jgi:hypothetical protein
MNIKKWFDRSLVGLALGLVSLAGCDNGGSTPPATGGAGIPGVRGPASPKTNAFAKGGMRKGAGPGARRAAPAPAEAPRGLN